MTPDVAVNVFQNYSYWLTLVNDLSLLVYLAYKRISALKQENVRLNELSFKATMFMI